MEKFDVAIVGAGIVGLAHAWSAAERGHSVVLLERSRQASGASIRNFGMIWPIGQTAGANFATALRSRERWLELKRRADLWVNPCGSIHLAHHEDELAVLEEFCSMPGTDAFEAEMVSADGVLERTPAANPDGLLGGMWSPNELCVNPREAIRQIPLWLIEDLGVVVNFETTVTEIVLPKVKAADGREWEAERVIVCGGSDIATLYPDAFCDEGLRLCKLQMLRTATQPDGWKIGAHIASGLTLRHYKAFEACPSLQKLKARIAEESPELDAYGIHVMASQNNHGEIILGDSHEYDDAIEPFDSVEIDALILRELKKIIRLPDWEIEQRWHGVYLKHPTKTGAREEVVPGVEVVTATGGAGMTLAFGLAEEFWN